MDNPASRALRNLISPGRIDAGARIESPNLRFFRRTALLPPPQQLFIVSDRSVFRRSDFFLHPDRAAVPAMLYRRAFASTALIWHS
jgi:hypothetical protein